MFCDLKSTGENLLKKFLSPFEKFECRALSNAGNKYVAKSSELISHK